MAHRSTHTHPTRLPLLLLLGLLLGCTEKKILQPSDFCRFVKTSVEGEGKLETAVVTYQRKGGVEVSLVAAVHVGDEAYYDALESLFAGQQAVLYELIADPEAIKSPERSQSGVSFLQRFLKSMLELEFQLDAIDYTRDNFVHADLDPETFVELQEKRGESIFTFMWDLMKEEMKRMEKGEGSEITAFTLLAAMLTDDHAKSLKYLIAQELERMMETLAGVDVDEEGKRKESVIVTDRNRKAIQVLKRELAKDRKRLCIFYGAAHMPDLEQRLMRDLGFTKKSQRWLTAWDVRAKKPAKSSR